ncbi:N-myristoyl transferase [Ascodesmis nigricans]|uniref:Glycylpeptide N-tetradecanoyltransferase n=1 Tax=Ascodesmis nigricans TaxID=341454 RepID=A0A4S2N6V3_9PEZI|nr:N-myristoyl transferase [Ascodesmis nigricans]
MPPKKEKQPERPSASSSTSKSEKDGKGLSPDAIQLLLNNNPALAGEMQGMDQNSIAELLKKLKVGDLMTGMATGGKNQKDMASYKFWSTQPVTRFDEPDAALPDGPIRENDLSRVKTSPGELIDGFEWVTMDLTDEHEMNEVYDLLTGHYVEDQEAMFRFNYSASFLDWALKSPGWLKEWHVGVRVSSSRKLVAFISGIPVTLKVRDNIIKCSEINFLCIHKKLRSKRLTPVLIKEITRRCNLKEVWNAIYTAGIILPKPVATCRYYHRSLNWLKLHETGFSPLPHNMTKARMISRYHLPTETKTVGLRELTAADLDQTHKLLTRYLNRFEMAPVMDRDEIEHWFLYKPAQGKERVVWCYVVEDPETKKITDMFSFYALDSSVIGNKKHETIHAAYLFYYASTVAFEDESDESKDVPSGSESDAVKKKLKERLNALAHDALILAKRYNFDVCNGLTLMDNVLFLEQQKFGAGDGNLHYYLFNWRTSMIRGGVDETNRIDEKNGSGIGVVML